MAKKDKQKDLIGDVQSANEEQVKQEAAKKSDMKSHHEPLIASWGFALIAAFLVWIGILALWFKQDIYERSHFVTTATRIINNQEIRDALSEQAADRIQERLPVVGRFGRPLFIDIFSGILSSDLFTTVNKKAVEAVHTQLFVEAREISYDISGSTRIIIPLLGLANQDLAQQAKNIPDKIILLHKGQFPTINKEAMLFVGFGPIIGAIGLLFFAIAVLTAKTMTRRFHYIFKASLSFAAISGLVVYGLSFVRSQIELRIIAETAQLIALRFYDTLTINILSFAKTAILIGLLTGLIMFVAKKKLFIEKGE